MDELAVHGEVRGWSAGYVSSDLATCRVHPTAVVGFVPRGRESAQPVRLGSNVQIGAFCVIEAGVTLGDDVEITHHSVVSFGSTVGSRSQLVQSVRVDSFARIGEDCIVGGNVPDRAVLGDRVTLMGELSHSYSDPTVPWGSVDEVSPVVLSGAVVAQGVQVIGGVVIGEGAYIVTGEIVRTDVPPGVLLANGKVRRLDSVKGLIRSRTSPET